MRTGTALLLTLAACGHPHGPSETRAALPPALTDLEASCEHAYGRALASDAAALALDIDRIGKDWSELRIDAGAAGAGDDLLDDLDASVSELGAAAANRAPAPQIARAANRISSSLADVYRLYTPKVAPGVMQLDYLGRELALDARAADLTTADRDLSALESAWADLQPEVPSDRAAPMSAAVHAARGAVSASDPHALAADADAIGARVVDLEALF